MLKQRTIPIALVTLGVMGGALGGFVLWFTQARDNARSHSCLLNLKQMGRGFAMYSQDYGSHFPLASGGDVALLNNKKTVGYKPSLGWGDTLQPYLKSDSIFQCPSEFAPQSFPRSRSGYTDYWLNANLSGVTKKALAFSTSTLLLGEGNDGTDKTDAAYSKSSLPASWLTNPNSPAWRHMGGANYLFADGHVAWLRPNEVTSCYGRTNCFAVK